MHHFLSILLKARNQSIHSRAGLSLLSPDKISHESQGMVRFQIEKKDVVHEFNPHSGIHDYL